MTLLQRKNLDKHGSTQKYGKCSQIRITAIFILAGIVVVAASVTARIYVPILAEQSIQTGIERYSATYGISAAVGRLDSIDRNGFSLQDLELESRDGGWSVSAPEVVIDLEMGGFLRNLVAGSSVPSRFTVTIPSASAVVTLDGRTQSIDSASLTLDAQIEPDPEPAGTVRIREASLDAPVVAGERISIVDVEYRFRARTIGSELPEGGVDIVVEEGTIAFGEEEIGFRPSLRGIPGGSYIPESLHLDISVPETPVQRLVDSIPTPLLGNLSGMVLEGKWQWDLELDLPLDRPSLMEWHSSGTLRDFSVLYLPPAADVRRLSERFVHRITGPDGEIHAPLLVGAMEPVSPVGLQALSGLSIGSVLNDPRRARWFP